ncbi:MULTISPECIES: NUDIX domain-containing protein [unclassified Micrococcus]|uniref:NUDIX hydrolase n=1 Tax=unclassified Micrococcus TaxID=2620948 RepID=UPI0020045CFE|nr:MULTISPECIES: NUDIX domain-containing protein [unclassified Micrococcus]
MTASPSADAPGEAIRVAAVVMARPDRRVLTVRKAGTTMFMFPGGKHLPGEDPVDTAVREVAEETGLRLHARELAHVGAWDTAAANEPGARLHAEVYALWRPIARHEVPAPTEEIVQLHWMDPAAPDAPAGHEVAPLLLPVLAAVAATPMF